MRDDGGSLSFRKMVCTRLWEKYSSQKSVGIEKTEEFSVDIMLLMNCPWTENVTLRELYRVQLHSCCNASEAMFLTKQNTRLGEKIKYETQRNTGKTVDQKLFDKLPHSSPWRNESRLQRCAVVGNAGILKNSSCGAEIDSADIVFRLNLAPLNFSQDVGTKTSLITINPSQIKVGYPDLGKNPKPLVDRMSIYGNAPVLISAFTHRGCTSFSLMVYDVLRKLRPKQRVLFFNPDYLWDLFQYWNKQGLKENRLTSGLMLASVALELCDSVHLYGFWPFNLDLFQHPVSHHYYDDIGPSRRMHAMPMEFLQLMKMHRQGLIHLHLMPCE